MRRERRSLWAFPRKPFVDTAVTPCRGRERKEGGQVQGWLKNLIAFVESVGDVRPPRANRQDILKTTASLSWNIKLAWPVCVRDQNTYELHTNASEQLPCYSTKLPQAA